MLSIKNSSNISFRHLFGRIRISHITGRTLQNIIHCMKKSLKIPKGQSESVYRRRIGNTMAKRKSTKGQTTIQNTYTKTKDRVTRTPLKTGGELRCSGRVGSSCSTSDTRPNQRLRIPSANVVVSFVLNYLMFLAQALGYTL